MLLTKEEVQECWDFAQLAAPHTQSVEFGDTKKRSNKEIARDIFVGKL